MKMRPGVLAVVALFASTAALAETEGLSTGVTGSATPASTAVGYGVSGNKIFELIGVVPVVATVTGTPASMAASVTLPSTGPLSFCGGLGSTTCSNDLWAAQWTIVSAPTGIQAIAAYQGSAPIRLVNNTGQIASLSLRCRVGNMTGSCIFVTRLIVLTDPLF
ncbi:MAG: hypothetical protein M3S32_00450 [Acidobacteriota bacterium]|nr:hypothetical protein [Acidobacteriota bacterium]